MSTFLAIQYIATASCCDKHMCVGYVRKSVDINYCLNYYVSITFCSISEPTTDIPPDTTSSTKFSVESTDGDVIPLNPKVIKSEDRAPSPEPGETALPVKRITFEDEQQSDRPVSGLYSEPADCLSRYHSESAAAKSTEEEMKIVDDAFKDITDKEPLYSSIPESHKKVKREKKKHKDKGKSKQESMHPTIAEDTTLENIDTSTLEGQQMHRMLDAASAGMF